MTGQQSTPGALVLYPVKFAGATPNMIVNPPPPSGVPVEGLPHSSFIVVTKRDGSREGAVQAIVDPPTDPYLNIVLYMKGPSDTQPQLIERRPVDPTDPNKQVVFYVFQSLLTNGVHVFFYEVERDSGNSGPSTECWVLYYRELPGGNDVPGNGPHPALSIQFDPLAGDNPSFGKDEVDKGVPLTLFYSFMEPYDKIILEIGTQRFEFILQPSEVGRPYVIVMTRQMFEKAGSNSALPFSFTVVRQTNDPTDKRRWSVVIKAYVDTERNIYDAPIPSEDPTNPADVPESVDLGKLKDFLFVLFQSTRPQWMSGDKARLKYACVPPTGATQTHTDEVPITGVPFPYQFKVPAAKVLENGKITASFEHIRGTEVVGFSKVATAQVIGDNIPELIVDTSPLFLTGLNVSLEGSGLNWLATGNDPTDTFANRGPTGGVPPYTCISSNVRVARVDSNGVVRSEGNGSATITVYDSAGQSKSFTVTTSNVTLLRINRTPMTAAQARQWIGSVGGTQFKFPPVPEPVLNVIATKFRGPLYDYYAIGLEDPVIPATQQCWVGFSNGVFKIGTLFGLHPAICRII